MLFSVDNAKLCILVIIIVVLSMTYLYLYADGLHQAEPLMSIYNVLPMRVQTILERVNRRCISDILWKFVPVLDHSLSEEVLS